MGKCRHDPSRYSSDPGTGKVYCFACKPPSLVSNPKEVTGKSLEDLKMEFYAILSDRNRISAKIAALEKQHSDTRAALEKQYNDARALLEEAHKRWLAKKHGN